MLGESVKDRFTTVAPEASDELVMTGRGEVNMEGIRNRTGWIFDPDLVFTFEKTKEGGSG